MASRLGSAMGLVDRPEVLAFAEGFVRHLAVQSVLTANAFFGQRMPTYLYRWPRATGWIRIMMDVVGGSTTERWWNGRHSRQPMYPCEVTLQGNFKPPERN